MRAIKFKTSNECNATAPTCNYALLFPLLTIDSALGECTSSIVEYPAFVDLFLKRHLPYNRKIIVRYGNDVESTFHVRESE